MKYSNSFTSYKRFKELHKWLPRNKRKDAQISRLLKRYHKPLAYILGNQPFLSHKIAVRPPVLIPRPETEHWVGELLKTPTVRDWRVLELCTGSGCIARALAEHCRSVVAVDKHPLAVELAQLNTRALANVRILQADIFDPRFMEQIGAQQFDVIVANPPYIPHSNRPKLSLSVGLWEDPRALFAKEAGTAFHARILEIAAGVFSPANAMNTEYNVHMEIDSRLGQRLELLRLLRARGITSFAFERDQFGRHRVLKCNIFYDS